WARDHHPELARLYATMPARFAAADPRAMAVILDDISRSHGNVRSFVRDIGVSESAIRALDEALTTR
ncbi:MAG: tyrosine-protein phosphatase, partial [Ilumatobacteraceae bacterium]